MACFSSAGKDINRACFTFSPGEHFNDLEKFESKSFVKRLLGLGDIGKIFEIVRDVVKKEDEEEFVNIVKTGNYTLRNMRMQYSSIMKMGSISQFMSFLPGVGPNLMNKVNEKDAVSKMKKFLVIMDSMTNKELDSEVPLDESRMIRIAKGSGTRVIEIQMMLQEYRRLRKMLQGLSKSGLTKGNNLENLQRNPNQIMKKMQNCMDPRMM